MKIDPIIKSLLKHNRSFDRLPNGDILVRADSSLPQELPLTIQSTPWLPSSEQVEVASWFNRQPTTEWSKREKTTWEAISKTEDFCGDDWLALKWYYTQSGCLYLRKDIGTLLNNWRGEIDRAKNYEPPKK